MIPSFGRAPQDFHHEPASGAAIQQRCRRIVATGTFFGPGFG